MPDLYSGSATSALNENDYLNKLYDKIYGSQKDTLKDNFDKSTAQLNSGKQNIQNQTDAYQERAQVEGDRAIENYKSAISQRPSGGSLGGEAQAGLSFGNQNQANANTLNQQQVAIDQELERQRQLLADRYSSEIKKAQADNDMARAEALYKAAIEEEEQLRQLRLEAAQLMAGVEDNSILDAIASGKNVKPDTKSKTWGSVLKYEDSINQIYDKANESARLEADMSLNQNMSDLDAKQKEAVRATDQKLTESYVDALIRNKNYQEVQSAYGQGSGVSDQARIARESGLTADLTNLRKLQLGKDADIEQKRLDIVNRYGQEIAKAQAENDLKRVQELYAAAEREEQLLVNEQKTVGGILADQGDYSMLGKLYGLSQDQIDHLQGTGAYGYAGGGSSGGDGNPKPKPSGPSLTELVNSGVITPQQAVEAATGKTTEQNKKDIWAVLPPKPYGT